LCSFFSSSHIISRYWPQFGAYLLRRINGTVAHTFLPEICIVRTVHVINGQPGRSRPLAFAEQALSANSRSCDADITDQQVRARLYRPRYGGRNLFDFSLTSITRALLRNQRIPFALPWSTSIKPTCWTEYLQRNMIAVVLIIFLVNGLNNAAHIDRTTYPGPADLCDRWVKIKSYA